MLINKPKKMPENTKINLSALLKTSSIPVDDIPAEIIESSESIETTIPSDNNPQISTNIEEKQVNASVEAGIIKDEPEVKSSFTLKTAAETTEDKANNAIIEEVKNEEESGTRHALSLERLKTRGRTKEEISDIAKKESEKAEIAKNLAAVNKQQEAEAAAEEVESDVEVFGNYESKFSTESKQILKRLRMPKTRIGMLLSLSFICLGVIGTLMLIDPETHSISNYKTSISSIYNDIKSDEATASEEDSFKTSNQSKNREIESTDIQNDLVVTEEPIESEDLEEKVAKKEEIKQENFKNFLRENYK